MPDLFAGAACRDYDPDLWFPEVGDRAAIDIRIQKKICWEQCPVRAACAALGERLGVRDGIWGGYLAGESRDRRRGNLRGKGKPS